MSDLPKSVGKAHRGAMRNYLKKNPSKQKIIEEAMSESRTPKPRTKPEKPEKGHRPPDVTQKSIDPSAFNTDAERFFVEMLRKRLTDQGPMRFNPACDWVAFKTHVSVETAKRYLRKFCADDPDAPFQVQDGFVHVRGKA